MDITNFSKPTPILLDTLTNLRIGKALDIGSSNGRNALYLARTGWNVSALDSDTESLLEIEKISKAENLNIKTYPKNIQDFQTTEKYNLIVCLMVLHFFTETEVKQVIKWIQDHTAEGGKNVISGFTNQNAPDTRPYLFKPDELPSYYRNWIISKYEEADSSVLNPHTDSLNTFNVARLIATKQ